jgi:hypothetical protein
MRETDAPAAALTAYSIDISNVPNEFGPAIERRFGKSGFRLITDNYHVTVRAMDK